MPVLDQIPRGLFTRPNGRCRRPGAMGTNVGVYVRVRGRVRVSGGVRGGGAPPVGALSWGTPCHDLDERIHAFACF